MTSPNSFASDTTGTGGPPSPKSLLAATRAKAVDRAEIFRLQAALDVSNPSAGLRLAAAGFGVSTYQHRMIRRAADGASGILPDHGIAGAGASATSPASDKRREKPPLGGRVVADPGRKARAGRG